MPKKTAGRAIVLSRDNKRSAWEVSYIISGQGKTLEAAWRSAHEIESQERFLGHKTQCIVVLEADYDAGNLRIRRPPRDFDFESRPKPLESQVLPPEADSREAVFATPDEIEPEEEFEELDAGGVDI